MAKKSGVMSTAAVVSSLNLGIKRPFIDALGIYGFVKILSILVDRNYIPHTQYILLMMIIFLFSALTSGEKKQVYTCLLFVFSLATFVGLKHFGFDHYPLWILETAFISCLVYNLVLYIRKMFEFNYGKSLLPTFFFLLFYFAFVFLQPNISTEALERPIIHFSELNITNFISINYKERYQFDLVYTGWNALTLLICSYSFRSQLKGTRKKK